MHVDASSLTAVTYKVQTTYSMCFLTSGKFWDKSQGSCTPEVLQCVAVHGMAVLRVVLHLVSISWPTRHAVEYCGENDAKWSTTTCGVYAYFNNTRHVMRYNMRHDMHQCCNLIIMLAICNHRAALHDVDGDKVVSTPVYLDNQNQIQNRSFFSVCIRPST